MIISVAGLTACATDNANSSDISAQDRPEKMYEDIAAEKDVLKENGFESGLGKPVLSINNTKEINIYSKE